MIEQLLNYIAQWLVWIAEQVINAMGRLIETLVNWLQQAFQSIFDWFSEVFNTLATYMQEVISGITAYFEEILQGIQDVVAKIWEGFQELTTGVMDSIREFIEDVWSELRSFIEDMVSAVTNWIEDIAQGVMDLISEGLEAISGIAESITTTIQEWADVVLTAIEEVYNVILENITKGIDTLLGGAGSLITAIETRLSDIAIGFEDAAKTVVSGVGELAEEHVWPIFDAAHKFIQDLVPEGEQEDATAFVGELQKLTTQKGNPEQYKQFLENYWTLAAPQKGIWATIMFTIIRIAGAVLLFGQLSSVQSQLYMQEFAKMFPYAIFTPADVTHLWRRGLVSETFAIDTIQRQGYDPENAKLVLKLSDQVPPEADVLHQWHRGLLPEAKLDDALYQRGYSDEYRDIMKRASFLIPPVNDLIVMAVREAFSPEVAERFGQYEDYPPELSEWAEKQALSEEWAKRYWAAHWSLPSPRQGFEMLHRGVIQEEDLNLLLRALDVMPFWRERLTQIAYTPFTRVDIRRMHKVGVMTEDEVLRAYQDIGYDAVKARKMTDFVLLLNAPKKADDEEELKTLTRSNIVGFYTDGLITRDRAVELLIDMGYSNTAAKLYLDSADLDGERAERKGEIDLILSLTKAGILSFVDAEDRLRGLGLETREVTKAITNLVREKQKTTRLPSRSEAEKMYKMGAIKLNEYEELLETLGYAPKWRDAFLNLVGKA